MHIKICGITNLDDAILCAENGANALGFVFYKQSKRYINPDAAAEIISNLPPFILKVGVFVNEDPGTINNIIKDTGLNIAQLHGSETVSHTKKICAPVIKSFRVDTNFNWDTINNFKNCTVLLDSFSRNEFGGSGKAFDWNNIPGILCNKIILSGGISIDNIEVVFRKIKPAAVDLSSSLEIEPGKKDSNKVKDFFKLFTLLNSHYSEERKSIF